MSTLHFHNTLIEITYPLEEVSLYANSLSRSLPDEARKLADDPEAMKREMRMIQRESRKVRRLEGQKELGVSMTLK